MSAAHTVPPPLMFSAQRTAGLSVGVWMIPEKGYYSYRTPLTGEGSLTYMGVRLPELPAGTIVKLAEDFDDKNWEHHAQWQVLRADGIRISIDWLRGTPLETVIAQIMMVVG